MSTFTLRLHNGTDSVTWRDTAGRPGQGDLAEAARAAGNQPVTVLVPGEDVLLTEARLPGGHRRQALQALPYALEEQLAADPESLHFAPGPKTTDNTWPTAVVDRERLREWLDRLAAAGIEPEVMAPDTLAVPLEEGRLTVLLAGAVALVRTGPFAGYVVDAANLALVLEAEARRREPDPPAVHILTGPEDQVPPEALRTGGHPCTVTRLDSEPIAVLAGSLNSDRRTISLLQGDYRRTTEWENLWRRWRTPVVLLLVLLITQGAGSVVHLLALRAEDRALTRRIETIYRATFPRARHVVNPRVQMEQRLARLGRLGRNSLLPLLAGLKPAFRVDGKWRASGLRYQEGRLELALVTKDVQLLDAIKKRLSASFAGTVKIENVSAGEGRVRARLILTAAEDRL